MIKNITVLSSEGQLIGATYPKRAQGLVKKGRARYLDGDETVIVLASSPIDETASQEDDMNMNSNFNFDEFIEKTKAAAHIAGEGIGHVADKAEAALEKAFESLKGSLEDIFANTEKMKEESEKSEDEFEALESEVNDALEDLIDSDAEATIEEMLSEIEDEDLEERMRAKIRSQIEREKAVREREKLYREKISEYQKKASELSKSTAATVSDAVNYTKQVFSATKEALKNKEAELKTKLSEKERNAETDGDEDLTVNEILRRIEAIRSENEFYENSISSVVDLPVSGPGDLGTQAKADAIARMVETKQKSNRYILEMYEKMLGERMEAQREEISSAGEKKEEERKLLEARFKVFNSLLESLSHVNRNEEPEKFDILKNSAIKYADSRFVSVSPDLLPAIVKLISECDSVNEPEKLAFYSELLEKLS